MALDDKKTTDCAHSSSEHEDLVLLEGTSSRDQREQKDHQMGDGSNLDHRCNGAWEDAEVAQGVRCTTSSNAIPRVVVICPLTKLPLVDPVVKPDGASYERSAIVNDDQRDVYYPNRALKDYLSAPASSDVIELFTCPITHDLMMDPVIDREGNTYERNDVEQWIQQHGKSPLTRTPMSVDELYDNTTLFWVLVQEIQPRHHRNQKDEEIIQEWKRASTSSIVTGMVPPQRQVSHLQQKNDRSRQT
jgi:U-box domain